MSRPSYCLIFENVGPNTGIGRVVSADLRIALGAGYDVSVVTQRLDDEFKNDVKWLPLYVPPRGFLLKWATAKRFMLRALGNKKFDILHAHQPQALPMADAFTCHFLTRVAYERDCLDDRKSLRGRLVRMQQKAVLKLEDRVYRNWNPSTTMIFSSHLVEKEFCRIYVPPPLHTVIDNSMPDLPLVTDEERISARLMLLGRRPEVPVVGFLGGVDKRKGYQAVVDAIAATDKLFLLMAGPYTEGFSDSRIGVRMKSLGTIRDVATFYAACDVILVPSVFDPMPLVVLEAIARGVPVIATEGVGNLPWLIQCNAGMEWKPGTPLEALVLHLLSHTSDFANGAAAMVKELSAESRSQKILEVYDDVLARKGGK